MAEDAMPGVEEVKALAPNYKREITFLIGVIALCAVILTGYHMAVDFVVKHGPDALSPVVTAQAATITEQGKQISDHETRIRAVEGTMARVDTNVSELLRRDDDRRSQARTR